MPSPRDADSVLTRFQERSGAQRDLLIYEEGKFIEAPDCAHAWSNINQFMFNATLLEGYRLGNRHVVPRVRVAIANWGNLIPLEDFGYRPNLRMNRLKRNYLNEESLNKIRAYMDARSPAKPATHGIIFGTGRKATPPCMVAGTFFWNPGRLLVNFYIRASEVTKTLGADFHFLDYIIRNAVPSYMHENLGPVVINLEMAYAMAQWFPLFDMIRPGYPLNTEHRFHQMCFTAIRKAQDYDYHSKWKPEKRLHTRYRIAFPKFRTNSEGRIVSGPSYFGRKKKLMSKG